mmetsp:Transcript_20753/g.44886  ORF Transcript_20753/g.44886 Transcript_20753/m.44886 type:complete len:866 (-) Transcript_20753:156-2753(-)
MPSSSRPPPLPSTLSSRLLSSINPQTGTCKHHPTVKLCELVQNNTRWVVRRKICYKCGSRPGGKDGKIGKFHRPGVSVSHVRSESRGRDKLSDFNGSSSNLRGRSTSGVGSGSRRGSMRSLSASRGGGRGVDRESGATLVSTKVSSRHAHHISEKHHRARSSSRPRASSVDRHTSSVDKRASVEAAYSKMMESEGRCDYEGAIVANNDVGAAAGVVVPQATATTHHNNNNEEDKDEEDDFDESDPIIIIPTLSSKDQLPPPPPRTNEEMERLVERLEMRRVNVKEITRSKSSKSVVDAVAELNEDVKELAIVDGAVEGGEKRKRGRMSRSKDHKLSKKDMVDTEETVVPSAAALALLESHTGSPAQPTQQRRSQRNHSSDKRKLSTDGGNNVKKSFTSNKNNVEKRFHRSIRSMEKDEDEDDDHNCQDEDDLISKTSSISTASAKMYRIQPPPNDNGYNGGNNELYAAHGELEGVVPPMYAEPTAFPPKDVMYDRSRSKSRSKSRGRGTAVGVIDPPAGTPVEGGRKVMRRVSASAPKVNGDAEHPQPKKSTSFRASQSVGEREKHVRHVSVSAIKESSALAKSSPRSTERKRSSSFHHVHHDDALIEGMPYSMAAKSLAASTARSSRRSTARASKSVGGDHNHHISSRDQKGSNLYSTEKSTSSPSQSTSKHESSKAQRRISTTTKEATSFSRRSSHRKTTPFDEVASKGGRSRHTSCTQPESLSSDEYNRQKKPIVEKVVEEGGCDDEKPVVLYKKRAHRKNEKIDAGSTSQPSKPMQHIALSSDEKSHASSISSSSTIEESFAFSNDEEDVDKSRRSGRNGTAEVTYDKNAMDKAVTILKKGKSALGGLKGSSRKWQSALFM